MPKTKISEFSATPGNNTDIDGINIAEGCAPSGINDAIRELMAQLKDFQAGTAGDSFNGPVGTSTAAAGAFTTLSATGVATFSSGTAGAPAITTTGDTNTGIFFPAADTVAASVGGTEGLRLTSTGLGVGTSTPADKLDVAITAAAPSNSNFLGITVGPTSGSTAVGEGVGIGFRIRNTAGGAIGGNGFGAAIYGVQTNTAANTGGLAFYTRSDASTFSERLRLNSSGNLGLGVTPSAWDLGKAIEVGTVGNSIWGVGSSNMVIGSNIYYASSSYKYANTAAASAYQQAGGVHYWYNAASGTAGNAISFTQAMTLTAAGDLGVGTSSPAYRLQVETASATGNIVGYFRQGSGAVAAILSTTNLVGFGNGATAGETRIYADGSSGLITFRTNGSERARIDSSGNLLVNSAGSGSTGRISVRKDTGVPLSVSNEGATGTLIEFSGNGIGALGSITHNGANTAYNTSSDYRLKDNQQPLTGSGAFIDALQPKTWDWKTNGSKGVGFIAHEVQAVSPGSVVGEKDGEQMQAMEYGSAEFIANIIAELQSLRARVAALESN
jgi:hypothetical protein